MGIFDLFSTKKRTEEITRALVAAYAVSKMNDAQREIVILEVYKIIQDVAHFACPSPKREINSIPRQLLFKLVLWLMR